MNSELIKAVSQAVIEAENVMRGIDIGSPLWGKTIAQAAIAAAEPYIRANVETKSRDCIEAQAAEIERLHKSASCLAESRQLAVKDIAELETEIERLREALVEASREIQGYKDALAQVEETP